MTYFPARVPLTFHQPQRVTSCYRIFSRKLWRMLMFQTITAIEGKKNQHYLHELKNKIHCYQEQFYLCWKTQSDVVQLVSSWLTWMMILKSSTSGMTRIIVSDREQTQCFWYIRWAFPPPSSITNESCHCQRNSCSPFLLYLKHFENKVD